MVSFYNLLLNACFWFPNSQHNVAAQSWKRNGWMVYLKKKLSLICNFYMCHSSQISIFLFCYSDWLNGTNRSEGLMGQWKRKPLYLFKLFLSEYYFPARSQYVRSMKIQMDEALAMDMTWEKVRGKSMLSGFCRHPDGLIKLQGKKVKELNPRPPLLPPLD